MIQNKGEIGHDSSFREDIKEKPFSFNAKVGNGGESPSYKPIEDAFNTLILKNCDKPWDWYKSLDIDKSDASKIRRGLLIPPLWLRIKISQYFKIDSTAIWKIEDLPYLKKQLKMQGEK